VQNGAMGLNQPTMKVAITSSLRSKRMARWSPWTLFTKYISQAQPFTPIAGHEFPTHGNKPCFSHQLGMYADQLHQIYTNAPTSLTPTGTQWNKSPIYKLHQYNRTLTFDTDEFPDLPKKKNPKQTKTGDQKTPVSNITTSSVSTTNTMNANALWDQIMADIKANLTKTFNQEITKLHTDITGKLTDLSNTITKDVKAQITAVLTTIQALNQHFTDVMECLPTTNTTTPAHKKSKGLGIDN